MVYVISLTLSLAFIGGCISKKDYLAKVEEGEKLSEQLTALSSEHDRLKEEKEALDKQVITLQDERSNLSTELVALRSEHDRLKSLD